MSNASMQSVGQILKELYDKQKVESLVFDNNAFLAALPKKMQFGGKYYPVLVQYGPGAGGGSGTFASAYANQSSPLIAEFLVTKTNMFQLATIQGDLLASAQTDAESFVNGLEVVVDGAFTAMQNRLAGQLARNGAGTLSAISAVANVSGNVYTVTLASSSQATLHEVGQVLLAVQNADASGSAPTDVATVTGIDRSLGILTVNCSTNIATNWPAGYYLAMQGDLPSASNTNYQPVANAAQTNNAIALQGIQSWCPLSISNSDNFYGVNRSVDKSRLGAVVYDGRSMSIEEGIQSASARLMANGGKPKQAYMSPATLNQLQISMGTRAIFCDMKVGKIGFSGIMVQTAAGTIECFADRSFADGLVYLINLDDWELRTQGEAPALIKYNDTDPEVIRLQDQDAAQVRVGLRGNLICKAPGRQAVVQVQSVSF